jgi:hypothetical protein
MANDNPNPQLQPLDLTSQIIAYEAGEMDDVDVVPFFQQLVDTGLAWQLQGHYGRMAHQMILDGWIHDKRSEPRS